MAAVVAGGALAAAGGLGSYFGGKEAADAAQAGAELQYDVALRALEDQRVARRESIDLMREFRDQQRADRDVAVAYAQPTTDELMILKRNMELRELATNRIFAALDRDQQLLDSVDPALKEAGSQAYRLLKGEEAAALKPLRDQRERDRAKLANVLRERLGSGFETSSAGIEALTRFDQETSSVLANAQQETLGSLLGISAQVRPNMVGQTAQASAALSNLDAIGANIAGSQVGRVVNAFTGNPVNAQVPIAPVDYGSVTQAAGNLSIGDIMKGQNLQGLFSGVSNLGGLLFAKGLFGNNSNPFTGGGLTGSPSGVSGDLPSFA